MDSDIAIGNLETNVGTIGTELPDKFNTFQANPIVVPYLKRYFQVVSVANNHTGDFGKDAFKQMLQILRKNKLQYFGGGLNIEEAHQPLIIKLKGFKIAIIGFNMFQPRSFEALDNQAGVAWGDIDQILQDIREVKKLKPDFVFVYPHWGVSFQKAPYQEQINFAHQMINAGADAIIGNHAHVTQTIEIYKNKPIFYSLGNFVFPGFNDKEGNTGWILKFTLGKNKISWNIHEIFINSKGIPELTGKIYSSNKN